MCIRDRNNRLLAYIFGGVNKSYRDQRKNVCGVNIYEWGENNSLPDTIINLYENSPLNASIIDHIVSDVQGEGLELAEGEFSELSELSVPNPNQSWNEFFGDLVWNFVLFEGVAIRIVYDELRVRIIEIYVVPTNYVRTTGNNFCLLYTSPSPRDRTRSRMPSSA